MINLLASASQAMGFHADTTMSGSVSRCILKVANQVTLVNPVTVWLYPMKVQLWGRVTAPWRVWLSCLGCSGPLHTCLSTKRSM